MAKTILSDNQAKILNAISKEKGVCDFFYLTGGTALAEYYLQHRLSEDLDFFSEREFDPQSISVFFKKYQKELGIIEIDYQQSFNRNLFFLHLDNDVIKTEFTYFPFPRIETIMKKDYLEIDSLLDIAVNKVFTIYQKPRSRDFIDLYLIIQTTKWNIEDLVKKAKAKFDFHIDLLQLGSQFLLVNTVADYPRMIAGISHDNWKNFFVEEAKKLEGRILD